MDSLSSNSQLKPSVNCLLCVKYMCVQLYLQVLNCVHVSTKAVKKTGFMCHLFDYVFRKLQEKQHVDLSSHDGP